jgi:diaminopimelate epimerase
MIDRLNFTKMHGNGNDFVVIDEFREAIIPEEVKSKIVRAICDRRFGVGADGLLFVQSSDIADAKFRYFNSDGSEAEMCGNGIRCFSRYIVEEGYAKEGKISVETRVGVLKLNVKREKGYLIRVNMGEIKDASEDIPVNIGKRRFWGERLKAGDTVYEVYAVNSGVPHAVIFVDNSELDEVDIMSARSIRYNPIFPNGTNVNFVSVLSKNEIRIRTYERGVEAETLSCGTGSVACAYVSSALGYTKPPVRVVTKGGELTIEFEGKIAYMTGSANRVFDGVLKVEELRIE